MGAVRGRAIVKLGPAMLAGFVTLLVLLSAGAGSAWATTCTDSWNGNGNDANWYNTNNWSAGVPTSSSNVCINDAEVNIDGNGGVAGAHAKTLTLTGSALDIAGGTNSTLGSLEVASGGSIDGASSILMTEICTSCGSAMGSSLTVDTGTLTNAGTITVAAGTDAASGRAIFANLTNTGAVDVEAPLLWSGGAINNQGMISLPSGKNLTLGNQSNLTSLTNATGGRVTNNAGTGAVDVEANATFTQGAGTVSPSAAGAAHPAVILDNSGFFAPDPKLSITGAGAGTFEAVGGAKLSGNIGSAQSLFINGSSGCPSLEGAQVTAASGFTNAGTVTVGGACDSSLKLTTGTLTNTGTLNMAAGASGITRELSGSLSNSGTLNIRGGTAFDKSGAQLTQTAGTTTLANGQSLDTSGSGATFHLQGGTLAGGGASQASEAVINGPVNNSGGNVVPGSATTPGLMGVNSYAQGSGGKLTIVVKGAGGPSRVGTHYSQLASGGSVTLGGTLAISTSANPSVNDFDTIVSGSSRSGTFAHVTGTFSPGWTFGYKASYGSNYVALAVGAPLQVRKTGVGTGKVTSSPSGINCGSTCQKLFFQEPKVTLTAHPANGSGFGGWSGGCTGSKTTCQVTMSQARTVTAKFLHATTTSLHSSLNPAKKGKKVTYTATVSPQPGGGTVKFTSGGSTISGCGSVAVNTSTSKATCSVTYHSTGSRTIQATYSGDATWARSASSKLTENVKS
jgi:hypothetical protein